MEADDEFLCQVCGKGAELRFPCRCTAIFFCSDAHRAEFTSSASQHYSACSRFAEQLRRGAPELDSLLESIVATCPSPAPSPSPRDACSVLKEAGVHGRGLFASCCPCGLEGPPRGLEGPPRGLEGPPRGLEGPPREPEGPPRCRPWPALPATTSTPAAAAPLPSLASLLLLPPGGENIRQLRPLAASSPPTGWREFLVARGLLPPPSLSPSSSPSPVAAAAATAAAAAAAMTLLHRPLTASLALDAAGWWGGEEEKAGGQRGAREGGRRRGNDDGKNDEDDENEIEPPRPFILHVAGASVDAEVAQWPSWLELAALGGGGVRGREEPRRKRSLAVALVGPTVPVSLAGASAAFSSSSAAGGGFSAITIEFSRGRYHDVVGSLEEADAVFAPDAGIAADFEGWKETILSWTRPRSQYRSPLPPVLVTDLTEEAALLSAAAVRKVLADAAAAAVADERTEEEGGGDEAGRGGRFRRFRVTDPTLNPFRSPARVRAPGGTALPAAAGGWAFWILEEKKEEVEENEKNE